MTASLRYSAEFMIGSLPTRAQRVLEVGCGDGALAQLLVEQSIEVVAVDTDPAAVEAAAARGVDARLQAWPAPVEGRFNAVLFTRSLHHIAPLEDAIEAAIAALLPGGRILVEDFCAEGGTKRSEAWFEGAVRELSERGALRDVTDVSAVTAKAAPDHSHDLHGSKAIAAALDAKGPVERGGAAYYFRYIERELADPEGAQAVLDEELRAIARGLIDPLGQRFVLIPARS